VPLHQGRECILIALLHEAIEEQVIGLLDRSAGLHQATEVPHHTP
jgi:hypothetical protein